MKLAEKGATAAAATTVKLAEKEVVAAAATAATAAQGWLMSPGDSGTCVQARLHPSRPSLTSLWCSGSPSVTDWAAAPPASCVPADDEKPPRSCNATLSPTPSEGLLHCSDNSQDGREKIQGCCRFGKIATPGGGSGGLSHCYPASIYLYASIVSNLTVNTSSLLCTSLLTGLIGNPPLLFTCLTLLTTLWFGCLIKPSDSS